MSFKFISIFSKSYAVKNWDAKPKNPTWKQVGFFMSSFDMFCQ